MCEFILLFLLFYAWHMMGVTIGYHRLLSHRSFKCAKAIEYFFVAGGYLAWEGSPLWWATVHRAHHRYTDEQLDPHSPRYGFINAYFGWFTRQGYPEHINPSQQAKDLTSDRLYRYLEQDGDWHRGHFLSLVHSLAFRVLLFALFGWKVAAASLLAGAVVQQVPLLLNVVCHKPKLGYKTYDTGDDSVNVWWVALLTTGEGWHNNHHAHPGSARSGLKKHEFDFAWIVLCALRSVGLVWDVHEAPREGELVPVPVRVLQRTTGN